MGVVECSSIEAGTRCSDARAGVNPNGDLRANGAHANEQKLVQYLW